MSKRQFESSSSEEQVTDDNDDVDPPARGEIESKSNAEFLENHGTVEEVRKIVRSILSIFHH